MRRCISLLVWALVLWSCAKPSTITTVGTTDWLDALASEQIGQGSTIEANQNKSFALCWKDATNPSNNMHVLKFIIVRMADHKVVEQGSVTMGAVKWMTDYKVEVSHAPGQVELERGVNSTTRTIDLTKYMDVIGR